MKSKDFEPKFQPDFEDYEEEEYEEKPKSGGWWRLPVGVILSVVIGCAVGGAVFAVGKGPSKAAVVETEETDAETRKSYGKTEKKESTISINITTDDEKNTDTETVIKLLIKDTDGRTSIDETEVPLNKLTEIGSLKKGSYILYIMRVPVSDKGTTYTLADNGIRFEVTGDAMPVALELKLSSSADGSTKVEVTNSDDSGVSYSYVSSEDYYYYTPSGTSTGGSSTEPSDNGGSSTEPSDKGSSAAQPGGNGGGSTQPGGNGGGSTQPSDGGGSSTQPSDGGSSVQPSDGGATDGGSDGGSDGGYDGGSDGGYDGGSDGGYDGGSDGGYDGGYDGGSDGGYDGGSEISVEAPAEVYADVPAAE